MDSLKKIEEKWQNIWNFEANVDEKLKKFFITFPIPYVNGLLHLGHAATFCRAEFLARYKRLKGFNVLLPQAFHTTGSPIMAAVYRLKSGDKKIVNDLLMQHVDEKEIEKFKNANYWVDYFIPKAVEALKKLGASIDFRRTFITTDPEKSFTKFVEWQYKKLAKKDLIKKGKHHVVYDLKVDKVIGDHDRPDEFVDISYVEGYIIKFYLEDFIIPCFTLRPETLLGVTNIWVNKDGEYLLVKVDGEKWILPNTIVIDEIKAQEHMVEVINKIDIKSLLYKRVKNPYTNEEVPILPSTFVDTEIGTGIVMSVPSHAPYDYIALIDLNDEIAKKCLQNMKSLFALEGYSEYPARDVVERMKITSQKDKEKLEKATEEIYSKEFYYGITKVIFGKFAGKRVCEIKDEFANELIKKRLAIKHCTLPIRFHSRYGNKCVVRLIDQWFINYSNQGWKNLALECVEQMIFYPKEAKNEIIRAIKNMRDWAFVHKDILGTRFFLDKEWFIESLSDSTIYMAFYTVAHSLKNCGEENLTEEFFDELFSKDKEFNYWYPLDLRVSGKDLLYNHLPFMIFHHVAIFDRKHWPKAIAINGHVLINGEKMSKSKGNFIPILDVLKKYSSDSLRFLLAMNSYSSLNDMNVEIGKIDKIEEEIVSWYDFCLKEFGNDLKKERMIDKWFETVLNKALKECEVFYEELDFRNVINKWYELERMFNWYLKRCKTPSKKYVEYYKKIRSLIVYPIIPHIVSEIFEKLNFELKWIEVSKVDENYLKVEKYMENLIEDIKSVLKLAKIEKIEKIKIIVCSREKASIVKRIIESNLSYEEAKRELSRLFKTNINPEILQRFVETELEEVALKENLEFLREEFGVEVVVEKEEESKEEKAKKSFPGKPSIVVV
ncbi:MAG: leucine--tRNA ligase [Candidatus Aenigmarchaeota archaeon]|nr:leucine--tRNA ligase [Candidatus Aenigmarchaeota archaeon]MDW8149241.1 leucine--tRNA ligase [Candidatus Aenigmarchaeota archaeon]